MKEAARAAGFVIEQLHELNVRVLDHRNTRKVLGELYVETFRVGIRIAGHLSALPQVDKLSAGQREPLVGDRVVRDVALVETDCLAIEIVGEGLVGRRRIAQRTRGQRDSGRKIVVQFALESEAHTDTGAVAIGASGTTGVPLKKVLAAHSNIAGPTETSQSGFKARHPLLFILRRDGIVGQSSLNVGVLRIELVDGILLGYRRLECRRLGLSVSGCLLRLLKLLLRSLILLRGLLQLLIGLLQFLLQGLNLLLLGCHGILESLDVRRRVGNRLASRFLGRRCGLSQQRRCQEQGCAYLENRLHFVSFCDIPDNPY